MAKLLTSFYDYTGTPGQTYGRDLVGRSIIFNLIGQTDHAAPGLCFCQGGCEYNPTGFDSDIPRYKWTVPDGVTSATFQLWGAGGYGAAAYHCQQGVPGGSGAFAQKTVAVSAGDVYTLCLGDWLSPPGGNFQGTSAYKCFDCTRACCESCAVEALNYGIRGPKAYVLGTGLTNFCAEGGNPGVTRGCGYMRDAANTSCGSTLKFACYENLYTCDILCRSTEDSDNDVMRRACFYGADDGGRGLHGYVQANCCYTCNLSSDTCSMQVMIPFTGYQPDFSNGWTGTASGGWAVSRFCSQDMGPFTTSSTRGINNKTPYIGGSASAVNNPMKWGAGGYSAFTTGGNLCCGARGGPNAIRVIFS